MIDKQKLLQWIEDKKYVYMVDVLDLSEYEIGLCVGATRILNLIQRDIELGEFDA